MIAEIPAKYAKITAPEAAAMLAMTRDALTIENNPHTAELTQHAAYLEQIIDLRMGSAVADPQIDDVRVGREAGSPAANQYGTFAVHHASPAQVRYLESLIAERDTTGVKVPSTLEGISKTAASALIDRLIDRPRKAGSVAPSNFRAASEKQINLIRKLAGEKLLDDAMQIVVDTVLGAPEKLEIGPASKLIDALFAAPRKPAQKSPEVELAAGAYRVGEKIVRVYLGQQSGKMLAAELVDVTAEDRDDAWSYLGLATRFVPADAHRLTVEECEAIAGSGQASFSWCCVCGRKLDDPNSVARGIGPICRAKQG